MIDKRLAVDGDLDDVWMVWLIPETVNMCYSDIKSSIHETLFCLLCIQRIDKAAIRIL